MVQVINDYGDSDNEDANKGVSTSDNVVTKEKDKTEKEDDKEEDDKDPRLVITYVSNERKLYVPNYPKYPMACE